MNLSNTLAARKAKNAQNIPAEKWAIMEHSTNELKALKLGDKALKVGDSLPVFNLPNVHGNPLSLGDFQQEFLIISFYRGGWCPFCNMELKALQQQLPELQKLGAELIAISPEMPDHSLTTSEKNELSFTVLSDANNVYAKSLGLVFQLPEDLRTVYHSFNLHVDVHNGNKAYELPMPATYIVNKERKVVYSFVPEDYTERLDPEIIKEVLSERGINS
ncbi:peroxiredoxin-like family protein [Spongiimicrobium salis]|uniref:peroxiredoxin-like family protein n=1 Tax=Spongiimicrobium salis TaxID=1667022 RepID=UPI00374CD71A